MTSAMVTFNGRITIPSNVIKQLGLKTGDNVDFIEIEKGRYALCPRTVADSSVEMNAPAMLRVPAAESVQ